MAEIIIAGARARAVVVLAALLSGTALARPQDPGSAPAAGSADAPVTSRPDLPAARRVIERAVESVGGSEALEEVKSLKYAIAVDMGGMTSTMTVRTAGPDRMLASGRQGPTTVEMGRIGDVGWVRDPTGLRLVAVKDVSNVNQLDLYGLVLGLGRNAGRFRTVDKITFDGAECAKIALDGAEGATFAYIGADDGLLHGIEQVQSTPSGAVLLTTTVSDWADVEPLRLFTRAGMTVAAAAGAGMPNMKVSLAYSEVEVNAVEESAFVIPDDVQKLADARATMPETSAPGTTSAPATAAGGKRSPMVESALKNLERMDLARLRMLTTMLEPQLANATSEAERADMEYLLEKLKERIAVLEAEDGGAGAGGQGGAGTGGGGGGA